jgi:CheY-like chemotaxis protein
MVSASTGEAGLHAATSQDPDVILLDLGLPDMDGMDLLRRFNSVVDIPVIIVTARGQPDDRALGLNTGAADYIVKPYDVGELIARMRRVIRNKVRQPEIYDDGVLRLDHNRRNAHVDGEAVAVSRREFQVLALLVRSPRTPGTDSDAHLGGLGHQRAVGQSDSRLDRAYRHAAHQARLAPPRPRRDRDNPRNRLRISAASPTGAWPTSRLQPCGPAPAPLAGLIWQSASRVRHAVVTSSPTGLRNPPSCSIVINPQQHRSA